MLTEHYHKQLGQMLINTYNIANSNAASVGRLVNNAMKYFLAEQERDAREAANQAQQAYLFDEDRIDTIGANGNEGLHYDEL